MLTGQFRSTPYVHPRGRQPGQPAPAPTAAAPPLRQGIETGVFTPQQTRQATNQAVADSYVQNNAYEASKRFARPGVSRGLSATRNMLPMMVNGRLGAAQAMVGVPFGDAAANASHQLGTEIGQDAEGLGWAGLGVQNQANAFSNQNRRADMGWSLLNQLLGW